MLMVTDSGDNHNAMAIDKLVAMLLTTSGIWEL